MTERDRELDVSSLRSKRGQQQLAPLKMARDLSEFMDMDSLDEEERERLCLHMRAVCSKRAAACVYFTDAGSTDKNESQLISSNNGARPPFKIYRYGNSMTFQENHNSIFFIMLAYCKSTSHHVRSASILLHKKKLIKQVNIVTVYALRTSHVFVDESEMHVWSGLAL
jgi:hypothetical protein